METEKLPKAADSPLLNFFVQVCAITFQVYSNLHYLIESCDYFSPFNLSFFEFILWTIR